MDRRIIFTRADGGITVRSPNANEMRPRETENAFLQRLSDHAVAKGKAVDVPVVIPLSDVPADRGYRSAWTRQGDSIGIDPAKARDVQIEHIASAGGDAAPLQNAIDNAPDLDTLKAIWPVGLPRP